MRARTIRTIDAVVFTLVVIAALVLGYTVAEAEERPTPRERQCRFQWVQPGTWTQREELLTAACIEDRWPVEGGLSRVVDIIDCESGWGRFAYNPAGPYVGLGQHVLSAWDDRLRSYTPVHWELRENWSNSRSMLTITIRMMSRVGLSPWSCA